MPVPSTVTAPGVPLPVPPVATTLVLAEVWNLVPAGTGARRVRHTPPAFTAPATCSLTTTFGMAVAPVAGGVGGMRVAGLAEATPTLETMASLTVVTKPAPSSVTLLTLYLIAPVGTLAPTL